MRHVFFVDVITLSLSTFIFPSIAKRNDRTICRSVPLESAEESAEAQFLARMGFEQIVGYPGGSPPKG